MIFIDVRLFLDDWISKGYHYVNIEKVLLSQGSGLTAIEYEIRAKKLGIYFVVFW